jgi:hypothetical protein
LFRFFLNLNGKQTRVIGILAELSENNFQAHQPSCVIFVNSLSPAILKQPNRASCAHKGIMIDDGFEAEPMEKNFGRHAFRPHVPPWHNSGTAKAARRTAMFNHRLNRALRQLNCVFGKHPPMANLTTAKIQHLDGMWRLLLELREVDDYVGAIGAQLEVWRVI